MLQASFLSLFKRGKQETPDEAKPEEPKPEEPKPEEQESEEAKPEEQKPEEPESEETKLEEPTPEDAAPEDPAPDTAEDSPDEERDEAEHDEAGTDADDEPEEADEPAADADPAVDDEPEEGDGPEADAEFEADGDSEPNDEPADDEDADPAPDPAAEDESDAGDAPESPETAEAADEKALAGKHARKAAKPEGPIEGFAADAVVGLWDRGYFTFSEPTEAERTAEKEKWEGMSPLRRTALRLNDKTDGRLYRHKWKVASLIAVLGIVAVGLPLGFAAGWGVGTGAIPVAPSEEEELVELSPNLELRNANVEERYAQLGIDEAEFDHVAPDQIEPITVSPVNLSPTAELERIAGLNVGEGTSVMLDVPLVNQLDDSDGGRRLMAGCEVASLAMILRHSGVEVTKEELQDAMPTAPLVNDEGYNSNPNYFFVGKMDGNEHGAGYSVYHEPVAALAHSYLLNRPYYVVDLTGQSFSTMLKELADGNPCWVITTTTMRPDAMFETWKTYEGDVVINWALHSVVVTGYDDQNVFINDPYGYEQNVPYNRDEFEQAWKLMGSQAVTIVPTAAVSTGGSPS